MASQYTKKGEYSTTTTSAGSDGIDRSYEAPQVVDDGLNAPQVVHRGDGLHPYTPKQEMYPHYGGQHSEQRQPRTILGLRRRNFWILFGVILIIVAATIGGSVGGSLAVQRSKYV